MTEAINNFKDKYSHKRDIDHVIDFLNSEYAGKNSINFNYDQALMKSHEWTTRINETHKKNISTGKTIILHDFKDGTTLEQLIDQEAKEYEGATLRHCVASYYDKKVYSLRKNGNPMYTLELKHIKANEPPELTQLAGKSNSKIKDEYKNYIIQLLELNFFQADDDRVIELLNCTIETTTIDFMKKYFENPFFVKYKKIKMMSKNTKLKQKKKIYICPQWVIGLFLENQNVTNDTLREAFKAAGNIRYIQYDVFDMDSPLDYIKIIMEKGYEYDSDHLALTLRAGRVETFRYLYYIQRVKPEFDLFEAACCSGRLPIVKELISDASIEEIEKNIEVRRKHCSHFHQDRTIKFLKETLLKRRKEDN